MKPNHFVIIACAGFVALASLLLALLADPSSALFLFGISAGATATIPLMIGIAVVKHHEDKIQPPPANYDQRSIVTHYDQRATNNYDQRAVNVSSSAPRLAQPQRPNTNAIQKR